MANQKLSQLTELAVEPADVDEIYISDGGTSKRITYGTLKTALLARANHTGTQTASTISDFASAVAATASVTANTAKISADDPALISALAEVTAEGTDYAVILDTSVSPNALKKILISDLLDNATHTGDVTGSAALTAQPAIITGKGAVTVAAGDLLLVADVSASPQVLGQVTASSVASLATPEGTAILSTGEVGGTKFLREDGDGTCSWQTVPAGTGDLKADGTVPLTANWDVGSFDITAEQFHSDIATGTAPFTVASTTVVTNLNADLLDGNEASAFAAAAHNHDSDYISVVGTPTAGNFPQLTAGGELVNSTYDETSFATAAQANATHSGDAVGDTALTLQPAAITGKGAVTVDGADLLLVTDVSASPQVLGQVTAQSIANLAPAVQGSAILSSDTSPLVTDGYVLTADGAGGAAWEAAAGGGTPGGSTGEIQYNNAGSFGGSYLNQGTNIIEQRNSTNAQTFRVFNSYTDASNGEWGFLRFNSNVFEVGTTANGSGTARAMRLSSASSTAEFAVGGSTRFLLLNNFFYGSATRAPALNNVQPAATTAVFTFSGDSDTGIGSSAADNVSVIAGGVEVLRLVEETGNAIQLATGQTVSGLPATAAVGMIARVTDADTPAVGSTVTGGAAAAALVWYNGSNWTVIGV